MKSKIIGVALLAVILYSCASKAVAVSSVPAQSVATVAYATAFVEGKNLYENNCAKCHKLFSPSEFKKEEWKPILTQMQRKARLDDVQMASISDYISSQL
jgi:cytochrome c5